MNININTAVIPNVGLQYSSFNQAGYKETGTTNQNLSVSKKSRDKTEAILGARASTTIDVSGVSVTPEAHGFIRQTLGGSSPKMDVRMDGAVSPLPTQSQKAAKTLYNVGVSLMARAGMMEYGIGYDGFFANKYTANQGTLKVRVNF